jgi:hypothetical protein
MRVQTLSRCTDHIVLEEALRLCDRQTCHFQCRLKEKYRECTTWNQQLTWLIHSHLWECILSNIRNQVLQVQ